MLRRLSRRLVAVLALGIFLPNAAFSSTLHACCMEMSGGHHASEGAGESHGAMAIHDGHVSHDAVAMHDGPASHAMHDAPAADDGDAAHEDHAAHDDGAAHDGHASHAADSGDSDSSGVCCCLVCDCAASNAGLVSPVATQSLETAATVAAAPAAYAAVLTSPVSHLRPYPTGPPSTTV